jgi:4-amino-4-deoxy-L-arabinose transferase-like glycosyltransferase
MEQIPSKNYRLFIGFTAVILLAMSTGVNHHRLFGPDEPREAEIARETLMDGWWVTPHLSGLPFMEKPPLYYNCVAAAYRLTGVISPAPARTVSVLFGILMLGATFALGYKWRGARAAWFSVFILLTMPRFWRYSHTVLLDIAMGALCVSAITCFAWAAFLPGDDRRVRSTLHLSALFAAGAFLTKGFFALFTIAVVIAAFCFFYGKRRLLGKLLTPVNLLIFLVPVGTWLLLYYREGGIAYLHEHFVNNILGRFLQVQFQLKGVHFYHTDLGHRLPWYFYLQVLPEILGLWTVGLPVALYYIVKIRHSVAPHEKSVIGFLLIWAFLPLFILSFSGIKERTYILPSYTAMALLIGYCLDRILSERGETGFKGARWLWLVVPFAIFSLAGSGMEPALFLCVALAGAAVPGIILARMLIGKNFLPALFMIFAIMINLLIILRSPNVLYLRYKRVCYMDLARETRDIIGDDTLFLYRPSDNIRGSIAFYANRTVPEIGTPEMLKQKLGSGGRAYVILEQGWLSDLTEDPALAKMLNPVPAPQFEKDPDNRLFCNTPLPTRR